jgi:hypothetical protein
MTRSRNGSKKQRRHPVDTESRRNPLFHVILEAVRAALERPHRPDSSRQEKARAASLALKQARAIKAAPVTVVAPPDLRRRL